MFAKLTALVGGGPALNYNVEPVPYEQAWGAWTHFPGTSRDDGSAVSVFKLAAADPNDLKLEAARNGVKRLRMLRHPNILAFKDSVETQEKGTHVLYLVTEAVKPLATVLKELSLSGKHRDEYLATGMLHMTDAVSFLNNSCNMIHGHLCMAAVVVTDTLDWKLHGFDLLSEHALTSDFALKHASWLVGSQYKPGEVAKMEWAAVQQGPPWAVDSWGLGCMMQEVFSGEPLRAVEQLRRTDVIPPALLADYQKLLSSQPGRRLNPAKVAESKFLNNRLVEVVGFMENISLKDSAEKDTFFKRLPGLVPAIPEPVAVRKVLPLLSRALEFGGAPPSAVSSLLLIGRMLEGDEFIRRVVPSLSRLFASSDRNLRRNLLESIESYGPHLTTDVVESQIYPPLSSGFSDENAYIRELTLKSILTLAPKMRQATLTTNLLKHLSRLQVDNEPSIRANTTVLLGNVAQYLGDAYCKKVLLNAFGRALKDSFPPARCAALRALVATSQHYSPEELACRALPAVTPLCVDALPDVRAAALACLETFGSVLKAHDAKLTKEAAAAAAAAGANAAAVGGSGGVAATSAGMLGWAMSSLAASAGLVGGGGSSAAAPAAAAAAAGAGSVQPPAAAAAAAAAPAARRSGSGGGGAGSGLGARPLGSGGRARASAGAGAAAAAGAAPSDGWDDDFDDDEAGGMDAEELEARSRLANLGAVRTQSSNSRLAGTRVNSSGSGSRPAASPLAAAAATAAAASGAGGWDSLDDAGDAWDSLEAPAAPAAPKALSPRVSSSSSSSRTSASQPASARPRPAGGTLGAKPKHAGAMKLGASKLGASKLGGQPANFDETEW